MASSLTMSNSFLLWALLVFVSIVYGQDNYSQVPALIPTAENTVLNITFSDPRATECGHAAAIQNESVTIYFSGRITPVCLNLDYIFTHPNLNQVQPKYRDESYRTTWSLSSPNGAIGWSPASFNYSQVFYSQQRVNPNRGADPSKPGYVFLRAYSDLDCPDDGYNKSATQWYSWDCANEEGVCSTLPYSIKSIQLAAADFRKGSCVEAVKFNHGTQAESHLVLIAAFFVGVVAFSTL